MCLRFVFLLITRVVAWLRLSRREETWRITEILILRLATTVSFGPTMTAPFGPTWRQRDGPMWPRFRRHREEAPRLGVPQHHRQAPRKAIHGYRHHALVNAVVRTACGLPARWPG